MEFSHVAGRAGASVSAMAGLVFSASVLTGGGAAAQGEDRRRLQIEADQLFKIILANPANLDASFHYAELQAKLGDYEAAIGALERMLFYNRNLPRVRLELGVLYFRLGSYLTARTYFEGAAAGADTPEEVRRRVATFISEIERRTSTHQNAFFVQLGTRFQTNANAGPNNPTIRALGFDATLDSRFRRRSDWNAFGQLSYTHVYDFENQRGDVWESNVTAYYAKQFTITRLDLGLLEVSTGPRLAIGEESGLSFRPYVLGGDVLLGSQQYFATAGGGAGLRWRLESGLTIDPNFEYRDRFFANSNNYQNASLQTGDLKIASLGVGGPTTFENAAWQSRLSFTANDARYRPFSYSQFGVEASLPVEFEPPFGLSARRWTFAPFAAYYRTDYRAADPLVDARTRRRDAEYRVGAALDTRLWGDVGAALTLQYQRTVSNLPNYSTSNFIVSFGPTARF